MIILKRTVIFALMILLASCSILDLIKKDRAAPDFIWKYGCRVKGSVQGERLNQSVELGPGLVLISGGSYTIEQQFHGKQYPVDNIGVTDSLSDSIVMMTIENPIYSWDSQMKEEDIKPFLLDKTEVRNVDWREYVEWVDHVYSDDPEMRDRVLPDTTVWVEELGYNDPYVDTYFRDPAFDQFPVVGVSWSQIIDYCSWRTDRANEVKLIMAGKIELPSENNLTKDNHFTTAKYKNKENVTVDPDLIAYSAMRRGSDLYGDYRLPTEAEWEYAALGIIESDDDELLSKEKIFPWDGHPYRYRKSLNDKVLLPPLANFVRGRGDYIGTDENSERTSPVKSYSPNDFGIWCMLGNVNEWVQDSYIAKSIYSTYSAELEDSILTLDYPNPIFKRSGDLVDLDFALMNYNSLDKYYTDYGTKLDSDFRIYKGGGWKDRSYWLHPSSRRYLHKDSGRSDLGFRCAMSINGDLLRDKKREKLERESERNRRKTERLERRINKKKR